MSRIILLGATGYIAEAFIRELSEQGLESLCLSREIVDYTQFKNLVWIFKSIKPSVVINCAAFIHKGLADACEDRKSETLMANLIFPQVLANACEVTGTHLIHVSTGCLYNGDNAGKGFSETDPATFSYRTQCGTYVGSKELAERVVGQYPFSWICRVRLPFDKYDHFRNYLSKLQRYPKVVHAVNSISHRQDFVKACLHLWKTRAPFGIYNIANRAPVDSAWICECINHVLKLGKKFEFWDSDEFLSAVARTPKSNCVLNVNKLLATGFQMPDVRDAIFQSLKEWVPEHTLITCS